MKTGFLILAAFVLVLCVPQAQGWTYEQVDTSGNWGQVEIEVMPSGMVCLCYQDAGTKHVLIARKDSMWHYDDLGIGHGLVLRHLVQNPPKRPAVLLSADSTVVYAIDMDTGWAFLTIHQSVTTARLAFDSAGNPALVDTGLGLSSDSYLDEWGEQDSVWNWNNIDYVEGDVDGWLDPPASFVLGPDNQFYIMWVRGENYFPYQYVLVAVGHTGDWIKQIVAGGNNEGVNALSLAPTDSAGFSACYDVSGESIPSGFFCDGDLLEPGASVSHSVVRVDASGRRQIVYNSGVLKHAYNTGIWHIDALPSEIDTSNWDFAVDSAGRPVIAFISSAGVFLARGDELGCNEQIPPTVVRHQTMPTIVRGVLTMPITAYRSPRAADLLDITGRKVLDLRPGANDVDRLAPGVYFVREEQSAISSQPSAVRKVILLR